MSKGGLTQPEWSPCTFFAFSLTSSASTGARRERHARHCAARRRGAEPGLRLPRREGSGQVRVRGHRPLRGQLDLSHYVLQGGHNATRLRKLHCMLRMIDKDGGPVGFCSEKGLSRF